MNPRGSPMKFNPASFIQMNANKSFELQQGKINTMTCTKKFSFIHRLNDEIPLAYVAFNDKQRGYQNNEFFSTKFQPTKKISDTYVSTYAKKQRNKNNPTRILFRIFCCRFIVIHLRHSVNEKIYREENKMQKTGYTGSSHADEKQLLGSSANVVFYHCEIFVSIRKYRSVTERNTHIYI